MAPPQGTFHHGSAYSQRRASVEGVDWRYEEKKEEPRREIALDTAFCIKKLKGHTKGLWLMQLGVGIVMLFVAILSDIRFGSTVWYDSSNAGGKLGGMQYAWAFFNLIASALGIWVYLGWKEELQLTQASLIYRQKLLVYASYFTWAFGVWTTAVVFTSFSGYSIEPGVNAVDLSCYFVIAVIMCLTSDFWALSKLLSLGTYTSKLAEEWRYQEEKKAADASLENHPLSGEKRRESTVNEKDVAMDIHQSERRNSAQKSGRRSSQSSKRRGSAAIAEGDEIELGSKDGHSGRTAALSPLTPAMSPINADSMMPPLSPREQVAVARGEDEDVLMPHAFERLWAGLERVGGFSTSIKMLVPRDEVVAHFTQRGFQVVAAGKGDGNVLRVLFCRRELSNNGLGEWFLAEIKVHEDAMQLEATFKSRKPEIVPDFVKLFRLQILYDMN